MLVHEGALARLSDAIHARLCNSVSIETAPVGAQPLDSRLTVRDRAGRRPGVRECHGFVIVMVRFTIFGRHSAIPEM